MKHELPMKSGWEQDAFSPWARRNLCVFRNHHAKATDMKRKYNKRVRAYARRELREEQE
jgi:hypothetical protein